MSLRRFIALALALTIWATLFSPAGAQKPPAAGQPKPHQVSTTAPPQAVQEAKALFERAIALQRKGQDKEAIAAYRTLLAKQPGAFPAWVNLGLLYMSHRDLQSAAQCFTKASALEPSNPMPLIQVALVYLDLRQPAKAQAAAAKAVKLAPANAQARFALGGAFAGTNNLPAAEREFRKAVALAPENARTHFNLGFVLTRERKFAEAEASMRKAVQIDPHLAEAHLTIGAIEQSRKDLKGAIASYKKAVAIAPESASAQFQLGVALQLQAERSHDAHVTDEAISAYARAISAAPKWLPPRVNIARLYFQIKNYGQAAVHFAAACNAKPGDLALQSDTALAEMYAAQASHDAIRKKELYASAERRYLKALAKQPIARYFSGLGYLYEQQNRPNDAARVYTKWSVRLPEDAMAWSSLGRIREAQHRVSDAIAAYNKAAVINPKDRVARTLVASLYERQGQLDLAADQYRKMLRDDPKDCESLRYLAGILVKQKQFGQAINMYESMKALLPKDPSPYLSIGSLYEQQNKPDDAIAEYRKLAAAIPDDVTGRENAARILETQKKYDEAVVLYRDIEKAKPTDITYLANIPRLLDLAGKPDEALAESLRLRDKDPKNSTFRDVYGAALERRNRWADAEAEYRSVVADNAQASWAWIRLGTVLLKQGHKADAQAAWLKAADLKMDAWTAYGKLEEMLAPEQNGQVWIALLQSRIRTNPGDTMAISKLEMAYPAANRAEPFLTFLKEVDGGKSTNHTFVLTYAAALLRYNKVVEAIEVYRRATAQDPDDMPTRYVLASQLENAKRIPEAIQVVEEIVRIPKLSASQRSAVRMRLANLFERNGQKADAIKQLQLLLKEDPKNATAESALKRLQD